MTCSMNVVVPERRSKFPWEGRDWEEGDKSDWAGRQLFVGAFLMGLGLHA